MIGDSDKIFNRFCPVYVSLQAYYKHRKDNKIENLVTLVSHTVKDLQDILDLPPDLKVRIAQFKGHQRGCYNPSEKTAHVTPTLDERQFLFTLCHELVHAEQFHTGRLGYMYNTLRNRYDYSWNGQLNTNRGTTYMAYREQPWEQEAFGRQGELAQKVVEMNPLVRGIVQGYGKK